MVVIPLQSARASVTRWFRFARPTPAGSVGISTELAWHSFWPLPAGSAEDDVCTAGHSAVDLSPNSDSYRPRLSHVLEQSQPGSVTSEVLTLAHRHVGALADMHAANPPPGVFSRGPLSLGRFGVAAREV